jgi:hypothetical protein
MLSTAALSQGFSLELLQQGSMCGGVPTLHMQFLGPVLMAAQGQNAARSPTKNPASVATGGRDVLPQTLAKPAVIQKL